MNIVKAWKTIKEKHPEKDLYLVIKDETLILKEKDNGEVFLILSPFIKQL